MSLIIIKIIISLTITTKTIKHIYSFTFVTNKTKFTELNVAHKTN